MKSDIPQLPAGAPGAAGGNGGNGQGGNGTGVGPGGNDPNGVAIGGLTAPSFGNGRGTGSGTGLPGPLAPGAISGTGNDPNGTGSGDGLIGGAPGVLVAGDGAPATGISGNGLGGPAPNGTGNGALLPKSGGVGLPFGQAAQGAAPRFAGSPSDAGPGNSPNGASGGARGNGPGGPGGPEAFGPGGDGSGRRFGSASLPGSVAVGSGGIAGGGTGGTGDEPSSNLLAGVPQLGVPDRRALPDGVSLAIPSGRFLPRSTIGAGGSDEVPVRSPTPGFIGRDRFHHPGSGTGPGDGSDAKTEASVEQGLEFLSRMQAADGHWSLHAFPGATADDTALIHSDTAATGLALLAYLGADYDHFDGKYHDAVRRGIEYLLDRQRADGDLFIPADDYTNAYSRFYSHGIATIALCEAYGMTGDKRLRVPAQKALDFIIASQNPALGGWALPAARKPTRRSPAGKQPP